MDDLTPDIILNAYRMGVFPMAEEKDDPEVFWVDPDIRGVFFFDQFHIPRKLQKLLQTTSYHIRCNENFADIISACAGGTPARPESWINPAIKKTFIDLHQLGHAHCVGCYDGDKLIGGVYGLAIGGAFFGESMFSHARDASKIALVHLMARCAHAGFDFVDAQFVNDHLTQFGILEIERDTYHTHLKHALGKDVTFNDRPDPDQNILYWFLQSTTHRS